MFFFLITGFLNIYTLFFLFPSSLKQIEESQQLHLEVRKSISQQLEVIYNSALMETNYTEWFIIVKIMNQSKVVYPYNFVFIFSLALDTKKVANTNWTTWQQAQTNAKRKNQPKKIMDTTRKNSSQITGQLFKATRFSQFFHPVTELWCHLSWRNGAYFHIGWQDPTSLPAKNDW